MPFGHMQTEYTFLACFAAKHSDCVNASYRWSSSHGATFTIQHNPILLQTCRKPSASKAAQEKRATKQLHPPTACNAFNAAITFGNEGPGGPEIILDTYKLSCCCITVRLNNIRAHRPADAAHGMCHSQGGGPWAYKKVNRRLQKSQWDHDSHAGSSTMACMACIPTPLPYLNNSCTIKQTHGAGTAPPTAGQLRLLDTTAAAFCYLTRNSSISLLSTTAQ